MEWKFGVTASTDELGHVRSSSAVHVLAAALSFSSVTATLPTHARHAPRLRTGRNNVLATTIRHRKERKDREPPHRAYASSVLRLSWSIREDKVAYGSSVVEQRGVVAVEIPREAQISHMYLIPPV